MPKPRPYREVLARLRKHDKRFEEWTNRGKGSERMLYHPDINGRPRSFPVKCHGGGTIIGKSAISAIIRRFNLPKGVL